MKKKTAFTVAELLIAMFIIGLISVAGIKTIDNIDKSAKYMYSNVYHSLDRALYNAMFFSNISNPFARTDNQGNNMTPQSRVTYLCRMLTEYFNTSSTNCNQGAVSQLGNAFGNPHFIAANGVRFYISSMLPNDENASHHFFLVFADLNGEKDQTLWHIIRLKQNRIFLLLQHSISVVSVRLVRLKSILII